MDNESKENSKPNKPVRTYRSGGISVAVFANKTDEGRVFYKFSFERIYQQNGKYKTTSAFSFTELPILIMLLTHAWYYILELSRNDETNKE